MQEVLNIHVRLYADIDMHVCMPNVCLYVYICPDASVVNASGTGQLQAHPHVAGPWLSPGKHTRRAVATMGSNDLVVGEDHMLGPSC